MNITSISKGQEKSISELSSEVETVVCLANLEACEAGATFAVAARQKALAGAWR